MKIRYIGNFPPPYGGVTVKNELLYQTLLKYFNVKRFDKSKFIPRNIYQIINMFLTLLPGQALIIGVSSKGGKSKLLTRLLYKFNKETMQHSLYFMMGGTEAKRIAENSDELIWYKNYRKIYVETLSMVDILKNAGLENVEWFPNCREYYSEPRSWLSKRNGHLQCVFFSKIEKQKGIDIIVDVAKMMPNAEFYFYGPVNEEDESFFLQAVSENNNIIYKGVFKGNNKETYEELRKYDVLLFPTRWETEGVPGILVEAKMAGIATVVSNKSFNAELVKDSVEGVVLKENTVEELFEAIKNLDKRNDLLEKYKRNSYLSAAQYTIENYIEDIVNTLKI